MEKVFEISMERVAEQRYAGEATWIQPDGIEAGTAEAAGYADAQFRMIVGSVVERVVWIAPDERAAKEYLRLLSGAMRRGAVNAIADKFGKK